MTSFVTPNDGNCPLVEVCEEGKPVVIGIDFGTAYSGIAYSAKEDPASVCLDAPSSKDPTQVKVPTSLLRLEDGTWKFGHEAEEIYYEMLQAHDYQSDPPIRMQLFKRFKMVLKDATRGYDTLTALSLAGTSCLLKDLITESLRILKDFALKRVNLGFGVEFLATHVQWVLTVPAIWNDFGKSFMRKAAFAAGLMDEEESDNLLLVQEPEAAALAVHVDAARFGLLGVSSRFMVLDCGGGVVDITVHEVTGVNPLAMKTISVPTGGDWGGDYVNLEFKKFLKELLGPDLYREKEAPYEFYSIYCEFDRVKRDFDRTSMPGNILLTDVLENRRDLLGLVERYNDSHPLTPILMTPTTRRGFLTMSKELMLSFYEPFLLATVNETRHIFTSTPNISHIIVVGGFGSSKVLTNRILSEFHNKQGVRVILPDPKPRPQSAIVQGAVYFGFHRNVTQSRIAAYTYGIATRDKDRHDIFSILVRKGQELPLNHTERFIGYVGRENLPITWNVYISDKTDPETTVSETFLGSLVKDCPLDPEKAHHQLTAIFIFGGSELRIVVENWKGEQFRKALRLV